MSVGFPVAPGGPPRRWPGPGPSGSGACRSPCPTRRTWPPPWTTGRRRPPGSGRSTAWSAGDGRLAGRQHRRRRASWPRWPGATGSSPPGRRCLVVGAGGAARAVVAALGDAGAAEVVVVNRTGGPGRDGRRCWPARPAGSGRPRRRPGATWWSTPRRPAWATSTAARPAGRSTPALLGPGQVVVDLVYHPPVTPWLAAAADAGGDHGQRPRHAGPPGRTADRALDRPRGPGGRHVGRGGRPGAPTRASRLTAGARPGRARPAAGSLSVRSPLVTYSTDTLATRSRHVSARIDPILLVTTGILALTGIVMIYSATKGKLALAGLDPHYYLKRQLIFFVISRGRPGGRLPLRLPPVGAAGHHPVRRDRAGPAGRAGRARLELATGPSAGSRSGRSSSSRRSSPPWCSSSPSPPTAPAGPRASSSATWSAWC